MNSKERVLYTINHVEPDKVPIDIWLAPEISNELSNFFKIDLSSEPYLLPKIMNNDVLYSHIGFCSVFNSIYDDNNKIGDNMYMDLWGIKCKRVSHKYGSYCEFVEHPFSDIKKYDSFKWPNPVEVEKNNLDIYKEVIDKDGKDYAIIGGVGCTMFEASWYLRGFEQLLTDFYLNRDFAVELLDRTMNYSLTIAKELVKMGVDIIFFGDDIGCEQGPLINPKVYREFIKPRHAYLIQEVKKINKDVKIAFHTDGKIEWVLNDLLDIGIEIINPLQPDANDVERIKKKYGKKLTIWGNVDTRRIMSTGSCSEVIKEVSNVISILSPGGGHILTSNHIVQAGPNALCNIFAYYWAAEKFRIYPINLKI